MSTGIVTRRKSAMHIDNSYGIDVVAANTNLVSRRVLKGEPFSTQIVCDEGYSVYEITIKMGGVDITSTAYDPTYNMISIASVTGDVDIECYAMHSIPSDYIRVDGIKNPSNAYLNTGYYVTPQSRLELYMSIEKISSTTYHATSKRSISGAIGSGWYTGVSAYAIQANVNDTAISMGLDTTQHIGEYYEFILDYYKKVSHIKGYNSKTLPEKTSTDPNTFAIFAAPENYGNAPNRVVKYFRIYDYSTTSYVRYYIPCLNDSGVAGFWDAARGVFQGSSNSTAFEAVNASGLTIKKVANIQSANGAQYIDLGEKINSDTDEIVLSFVHVDDKRNTGVFGARTALNEKNFSANWYSPSNQRNTVADCNNSDYSLYRATSNQCLFADTTTITISKNKRELKYGSTVVKTNTSVSDSFITDVNATLFAINTPDGLAFEGRKAAIKFVSLIWKRNGVVIHNYIPVRIGNDGYIYDKILRIFKGSDAGGYFTPGTDI